MSTRADEMLAREQEAFDPKCELIDYAKLKGGVETITYRLRQENAFDQIRVATYIHEEPAFTSVVRVWRSADPSEILQRGRVETTTTARDGFVVLDPAGEQVEFVACDADGAKRDNVLVATARRYDDMHGVIDTREVESS